MGDHRGEPEDTLELHARVAEAVCGWATIQYEEWSGSFVPLLWHESFGTPRGRDFGRLADGRWVPWSLPHYSTSLDACATAEADLARRGLQRAYVMALLNEVSAEPEHAGRNLWYADHEDFFAITTAPPAARVRAMLRTVEAL